MQIAEMSLDEISVRLLDAFRSGKLPLDTKGPVLGFAAAMKRVRGPSPKQIEMARSMVRSIRYMDGTEPVELIDRGDNEKTRAPGEGLRGS